MFQGARAQESILGDRWRLRRGGHQCGYYLLYSATGVIVDLGREVTSEPSTSPEDRYTSGPLVDGTRRIGLGGISIPESCHSGTACAGWSGTPKNRRPLSASDRSGPAHAASRALLATHALKTLHPGSTPHWGGLRALVVALVLQRAHARPRATCCRC